MNLERFEVVELSKAEQQKTNGGSLIFALAIICVAVTAVVIVADYVVDKFCE